jgi:hypothetical protein
LPQVTAAQELQIKAEARLASLMEEKLVTRISVLSTLLGGGKTTERLLVRISIETHKTSPDFDQAAADKAKNRIKQALGEIGCDVFIETGPLKANDWQVHLSSSHPGAPAFPPFLLQKLCPRARRRTLPWPSHRVRRRLHPPVRLASSSG